MLETSLVAALLSPSAGRLAEGNFFFLIIFLYLSTLATMPAKIEVNPYRKKGVTGTIPQKIDQ